MMRHQQEMQCLGFYEEAIGILTELTEEEEFLNARISDVVLELPPEIGSKLRPLIGTFIGILRTDIPQKEYLVCSISESKSLALKQGSSIRSTPSVV
jgi:hypothetical protein